VSRAGRAPAARTVEIAGDLDRVAAELLALEIRRLASAEGVELEDVTIVPARRPSDERGDRGTTRAPLC
jgi:hypothetical protein